jgi:ABC-type protease/lipase transport system fused ATPase/permease subunit
VLNSCELQHIRQHITDWQNWRVAPHCYKRLPEVLAEHSASVRVLHTLKPLGVAMAGKNEFDPFKD